MYQNLGRGARGWWVLSWGLVLVSDGPPDLAHDEVGLNGAAGIDSPALLLSGHSADVGSNVVEDGGLGNVDNVSLAEVGGNGELILLLKRDYFIR